MSTFELTQLAQTPPFVAWSIRYPCQLRRRSPNQLPITVERILRPVREWANGIRENRVVGDVCLSVGQTDDEPRGFPIEETLARYGGETAIVRHCECCPANVANREAQLSVAGCHGWFPVTDELWTAFLNFDRQHTDQRELLPPSDRFLKTSPRLHAIWLVESLAGADLAWPINSLTSLLACHAEELQKRPASTVQSRIKRESWRGLQAFVAALSRVEQADLVVDLQMIPAGRRKNREWIWDDHCDRCRINRRPSERKCAVCGKTGGVQQGTRRSAMGKRPYIPLEKFLSDEQAQGVLLEMRERAELG